MEIVPKKNQNGRIARTRRGAALMYALLVVFILSLILLAMGGLVTSHFKEEENTATYSRLLYSAEAAANWQLLQVSRAVPNLPNGSTPSNPGAGFQTLDSLNRSRPAIGDYTNINDDLGGIQVSDNVQAWATNPDGNQWTPPNSCFVYAIASDPQNPSVRRGVSFTATGTKLSDRFTIFGRDSVNFNAGSQTCKIARGFVGSNGPISYSGSPPQSVKNSPLGGFRGCLLTGPQATLVNPSGWPTDPNPALSIDYPHLPDPTILPSIDQVVSYTLPGTDISALKNSPRTRNNQGRRAQLVTDHRDGSSRDSNGNLIYPYPAIGAMVSMNYRAGLKTFDSTQFKDLGPVTSLGEAQFSQSVFADDPASPTYYPPPVNPANGKPLRVIRLHAYISDVVTASDQDPNVFYFSNIQMKDNDVLLLDVPQDTFGRRGAPTACRIVIHNNSLSQPIHITNVAVVQVTNADVQHAGKETVGDSAFIFYNDTNQPLSFQPKITLPATGNAFYDSTLDKLSVDKVAAQDTDFPSQAFILTPGCPGLAYGIRAANTSLPAGVNDLGGSVVIDGSYVPCTVIGAIATQVTLIGAVTVGQNVMQYTGKNAHPIARTTVVESSADPFQYQYFYHVTSDYQEINPDAISTPATPAFGYGSPPQ